MTTCNDKSATFDSVLMNAGPRRRSGQAAPDGGDAALIYGQSRRTVAMLVMFLVAMDAWATTMWLRTGFGYELNPLMAWLVEEGGDFFFLLTKLLGSGLCMLWVVHRASYTHARIASWSALAIYGSITGLHIFNGMAYLPG